jgi:hypothetical protein
MKEVLSVFTFGIGALCFVVFVTVLKPNANSAVPKPYTMPPPNIWAAKHRTFRHLRFRPISEPRRTSDRQLWSRKRKSRAQRTWGTSSSEHGPSPPEI